jgi:hypothetical protein
MLIHSEPNGFLMVRYKLYFNQHHPDPEDAWVRTYLQEHGLEPRCQLEETHDGVPYTVLHFGQCYLGRHTEALGQLYQRGIEHSTLAEHLEQLLSAADDPALQGLPVPVDAAARWAVAAELAALLHTTARFEVTAAGQLQVTIDTAVVTAALQARQEGSQAS